MTRSAVAALLLCLLAAVLVLPASAQPMPKKLIEYGWDVPAPSFVAQNIREMEKRPFEGLIFRVPTIGSVFANKKWDEKDPKIAAELQACSEIQWGKFTDNFVIMYAASTMDWFSDADWECVQSNVRLCAKAARLARCKGVCFDAEPYGSNPWLYSRQAQADTKTFAEYAAQARKRGAQFMNQIQAELPNAVVHTFFQLSILSRYGNEPDLAERDRRLGAEGYGLLPAFLNGMLDVAGPNITITDGNESSYYYTEPLPYYRAYQTIHQTCLGLVAPENRAKYRAQMQCAQALYVDYLFDYWGRGTPARHMTPEERAKWWEHNVYYSLATTDEYVWLYSEKMNWWQDKNLPPGMEQALVSAKDKLAKRQPLGFEMTDIIKQARQREAEELQKRLGDKSAQVRRITELEVPEIDGQLGDAAWKRSPALGPFMPYASQKDDSLKAQTHAWVAYDAKALYLAVRCEEPQTNLLRPVGDKRDDDVWLGDSVDVFLTSGTARTPFFHFILSPKNVCWDARNTDAGNQDLTWNPTYKTAASVDAKGWSVELAIPWSALGVADAAPGKSILANVCRQRVTPAGNEYSSWSRCVQGFIEPERFGTWVLQ